MSAIKVMAPHQSCGLAPHGHRVRTLDQIGRHHRVGQFCANAQSWEHLTLAKHYEAEKYPRRDYKRLISLPPI